MADITGFTYAQVGDSKIEDGSGYRVNVFALTTAAGEYPTGGIPLNNNQLGCPNRLVALRILEASAADELQYIHDVSANKIKVIRDDGTSGVPAEHANATFTSPDQLIVEAVGY